MATATAAELFDAIVTHVTNDDDGEGGGGESCTIENMEAFAASVKRELLTTKAGDDDDDDDRQIVVDVDEVVAAANDGAVVLDVRSPGEYAKGHVPGAVNVPLFTDDERAKVGTAFAKQGRGVAMVMGMKCVRPKLPSILQKALELAAARATQLRERRAAAAAGGDGGDSHGNGGGGGGGGGGDDAAAPVKVYVHCWPGRLFTQHVFLST